MSGSGYWTDIKVKIAAKDLDTAASIANMTVRGGISIEDYSTLDDDLAMFGPIEIVDKKLLEADRTVSYVHVYISPEDNPMEAISFMKERLAQAGIRFEITTDDVREEDWANSWKRFFKPTPVGERLLIHPSWESVAKSRKKFPGRVILTIDPGMAFGSGQHETTKLCMELIEKNITADCEMLDVGTGSGILSIAGLLLGAKHATGIDIDKMSVKVAAENAQINGVGDRFTAVCGDLATGIDGRFNMITANIVADIIMRLLPDAVRLLDDRGTFIASGIISERREDMLDSFEKAGLAVTEERDDRGWCAFSCRKKK